MTKILAALSFYVHRAMYESTILSTSGRWPVDRRSSPEVSLNSINWWCLAIHWKNMSTNGIHIILRWIFNVAALADEIVYIDYFFISFFFCWSVVSIVKTLGSHSPRVFLQLCSEVFTSSAYVTFTTEDDRWDQKSNRQDIIRFTVKSQISFDIEY